MDRHHIARVLATTARDWFAARVRSLAPPAGAARPMLPPPPRPNV